MSTGRPTPEDRHGLPGAQIPSGVFDRLRGGLSDGPPLLLGLAVLANFGSSASRVMLGPLVPSITDAFTVSNSVVGLALSGMWVAFAFAQYPSGVFGDRYGERPLVLVALAAITTGGLVVTFAPTFPVFVLGVVPLGAGAGLYLVASTSYLTKQFDDTGTVLGVHGAGASLAGFAVPVAVAAIAARFGFRAGLLAGTATAPVALLLFFRYGRHTSPTPGMNVRERFAPDAFRAYLRRRGVRFTMLLAGLSYFTYTATASFFPTFLVEFHGLSTTAASVGFAAIYLLRSVLVPVFGRSSDRLGRDPLLAGCFAVGAGGYLLLLVRGSTPALVLGILLLGAGLSFGGVITSRFMDDLTDEERGQGYGFANTVANVVGSTGSVVVGGISTAVGWPAAIVLLSGLLGVTVVALVTNSLLGNAG